MSVLSTLWGERTGLWEGRGLEGKANHQQRVVPRPCLPCQGEALGTQCLRTQGAPEAPALLGVRPAFWKADADPRPRAVRQWTPPNRERAGMGVCLAAESLGRCRMRAFKGRRFSIAPLQARPYRLFAQEWGAGEKAGILARSSCSTRAYGGSQPFPMAGCNVDPVPRPTW